MKRARFVEDAKQDPQRYYRTPYDVIRDRRLTNGDRLEILAVWERGIGSTKDSDEQSAEKLEQLRRVREEIERGADGPAPSEAGLETAKTQRSQ
jgi:hypothetical protein